MHDSKNNLAKITDIEDIIDIIHLPAAILKFSDKEELEEVTHRNSFLVTLFKPWEEDVIPFPNAVIIALNSFLKKKPSGSEPERAARRAQPRRGLQPLHPGQEGPDRAFRHHDRGP